MRGPYAEPDAGALRRRQWRVVAICYAAAALAIVVDPCRLTTGVAFLCGLWVLIESARWQDKLGRRTVLRLWLATAGALALYVAGAVVAVALFAASMP